MQSYLHFVYINEKESLKDKGASRALYIITNKEKFIR